MVRCGQRDQKQLVGSDSGCGIGQDCRFCVEEPGMKEVELVEEGVKVAKAECRAACVVVRPEAWVVVGRTPMQNSGAYRLGSKAEEGEESARGEETAQPGWQSHASSL